MAHHFSKSLLFATMLGVTACDGDADSKDPKETQAEGTKSDPENQAPPVDKAQLETLLALPVEGFTVGTPRIMSDVGMVELKNEQLTVRVTIQPCMGMMTCPELTKAEFDSRKDDIMAGIIGKDDMNAPGLIFEFNEKEVAGRPTVGTQVSVFRSTESAEGRKSTSFHHFHSVLSHDSANLIRAEAQLSFGNFPDSQEDAEKRAPLSELQSTAERVVEIYSKELFQTE